MRNFLELAVDIELLTDGSVFVVLEHDGYVSPCAYVNLGFGVFVEQTETFGTAAHTHTP